MLERARPMRMMKMIGTRKEFGKESGTGKGTEGGTGNEIVEETETETDMRAERVILKGKKKEIGTEKEGEGD